MSEKKKYWIIDYSFYIYNGTFALSSKCDCSKLPTCVICDGSGYKFLKTPKGIVTGGLFSVMKQIMDKHEEGWEIVIAFDPPSADLDRTKLLESYKGNRGDKPEYITTQMAIGMDVLPLMTCVECWTSPNDESDDVMAALAVKYALEGHQVVVASRDKDMFPILDVDGISIFRDGELFTREKFIEKFGFTPGRFNEYLALAGDSADNFNLFKGLGDVAAKWLVNNTNHILEVYDPEVWAKIPQKYKKVLARLNEDGSVKEYRKEDLRLSLQLATLNYAANCVRIDKKPNKFILKNELENLHFKGALTKLDILCKEER